MKLLLQLKKYIVFAPKYFQSMTMKWKKEILLNDARQRAIIGANFNMLDYNEHAGIQMRIYNMGSPESIFIGDNVFIDGTLSCNRNGRIMIGDYTVINPNTFIAADNLIRIGRYCFIARDVLIQDNNSHPIDPEKRKNQAMHHRSSMSDTYDSDNSPIEIDDCVWIGTRAIILKNVRIGYGSIVAAGAVVTNDVPPMVLVGGNPARIIKKIEPLS